MSFVTAGSQDGFSCKETCRFKPPLLHKLEAQLTFSENPKLLHVRAKEYRGSRLNAWLAFR